MKATFISQLDEVISEYENAQRRSRHDDCSDVLSDVDVRELETRCLAVIERAGGQSSTYVSRAQNILQSKGHAWGHLAALIGIAKSLRHDLDKDYLKSFEELVRGDLFSDYLEMADHLNETGYKDAAAVIAGSTLEAHLKQLCSKFGVATFSGSKSKKADTLNADLVKANAYTKLDQKSVTAWLGLRNDAAHGNYKKYTKDQVALLIANVRDFILRHPA